ncbi:MAG: sulfatase-like hydrolase/transferase [Verrucomicrobiota bacterium]
MNYLKLFFLLFLGFVFTASAAQKNILLIIADDYGADSSSLYNTNASATLPPTPNIVSLAQNGVLFRNAYANPVCSPTRACLITGRHGFRTGVGDVGMGTTATLGALEFTLPEAFAANSGLGFSLAQFGKWHLANGPNSPSTIGGWTNFAGSLQGAIANYTNWTKTVNGVSTANYTNYATTDLVNDAVAWIQGRGTNAWFAWIAFNAPHTPLHKPPISLCPHYTSLSGTQADINANPKNYFAAMTEAMDTEMGRLLAAVNLTNTHIIFMGDNGTMGNVIQPPYLSTRGKDTLYEGGIHVPFIIRSPSVVNPGRTNDTPVHAVDVFATILELATINVAATVPTNISIDSRSLLPMLQSTSAVTRYSYSEKFDTNAPVASDGRTLRNAEFKLIQFHDGHEEFFNLLNDPYESTNLLSRALTATEQGNYYNLLLKFSEYQDGIPTTVITKFSKTNLQFSIAVQRTTNLTYSLWRAAELDALAWVPVSSALIVTNGVVTVTLTDTNATAAQNFYRVISTPF